MTDRRRMNGEQLAALRACPVGNLHHLPRVSVGALYRARVFLVGDLLALTEDEVIALPGMGEVSTFALRRALRRHGLDLRGGGR